MSTPRSGREKRHCCFVIVAFVQKQTMQDVQPTLDALPYDVMAVGATTSALQPAMCVHSRIIYLSG